MTDINTPRRLHGTVIRYCGKGFLLLGDPGCGKSELALMLIERGAELVADDQVIVTQEAGGVFAECPDAIRGLLHIRGLGIISIPHLKRTALHIVLQSTHAEDVLPPSENRYTVADVALPCYGLCFKHPAALAKIMVLAEKGIGRLLPVN